MNKQDILRLYQEKLNTNNPIYRYVVIDEKENITNYFQDALYYEKDLNTYVVYFDYKPTQFLEKLNKYLIGCNEQTLEKQIINLLHQNNLTISTCESCTGGLIIARLIGIPGASNVINEAYVTYSNEAKMKVLGVKKETIRKYTVTSVEVAEEMAVGLMKVTGANYCLSITGFAGGEDKNPENGLFYFGILVNDNKYNDYLHLEKAKVEGTRNECREAQATYILWRTYLILKNNHTSFASIK